MEGAEPLVPRDFECAVVTFKVAVVHLVVKIAQMPALAAAGPQAFMSSMGGDGVERVEHQMRDQMDWMRGHDEMDQRCAEVKQVFDRVHR